MPDPGVHMYVLDMLDEDFNVDMEALPEHWVPLCIMGALDWVVLCQWWIFRNTGLFESDEPYKFIFDYNGYEFDPDHLIMYRDDADRNLFKERIESPGITDRERTEALPFLEHEVFGTWLKGERGLSAQEAEKFIPPREFLTITMWATFMWILDTYGRDWIYMQDEVLACTYDFGVSYVSRWDNTLLDPNVMICTDRELSSCRYCDEVLWCVAGADVDNLWQFVCNNCLVALGEEGRGVQESDKRISSPKCPHLSGADGCPGTCMSTCPHSGVNPDVVWDRLADAGEARVEAYRERTRAMGGRNHRQVAGQTLRDMVDHFSGENTLDWREQRRLEIKESQ